MSIDNTPLDTLSVDVDFGSAAPATESEPSAHEAQEIEISPDDSFFSPDSDESFDEETSEHSESPKASNASKSNREATATIEIKGDKKTHAFKLDPNDPELKTTLSFGVAARRYQAERDDARKERDAEKAASGKAREAAKVWDEIRDYVGKDDLDRVVQAVLGPEKYSKYNEAKYKERIAYESASPAERSLMDRKREVEMQARQTTVKDSKIKELEDKIAASEERSDLNHLRSFVTPALQKYSFEGKIKDADLANELTETLYVSAMTSLEKMAADYNKANNGLDMELTPQIVEQVFSRKYKALAGSAQAMADKQVKETTQARRDQAKSRAKIASTRNYTQPSSKDLDAVASDPRALLKYLGRVARR